MSSAERSGTGTPMVRFLLGPAGAGKTWRCVEEVGAELERSPEGPVLLFLAPKQATFQLERRLLTGPRAGYTRLRILSFERLAELVLDLFGGERHAVLDEEGRLMVLRALLQERQDELRVLRSTARLPGLARHLSVTLREVQQSRCGPADLLALARRVEPDSPVGDKLQDVALLLQAYFDWLRARGLSDAGQRLDLAADELRRAHNNAAPSCEAGFQFAGLWLDGFAELTPQEVGLLVALAPRCGRITLAFCLAAPSPEELPWLSPWSVVSRSVRRLRERLAELPGCRIEIERLPRAPGRGRFSSQPLLAELERRWVTPAPETVSGRDDAPTSAAAEPGAAEAIRLVVCADPETEAVFAAREIRRYVRERQARFRDTAVLVRSLEGYHDPLRRVFLRYEIPFFLDRREPVAHHPLAELTRLALRTVAFGWQPEDWFGVLKTGLVSANDEELDELEHAALAHGWRGEVWLRPLDLPEAGSSARRLERVRQRVVEPLRDLATALAGRGPGGAQLAGALRALWDRLGVEDRLADWTRRESPPHGFLMSSSPHATVWDQMQAWAANLELAFGSTALGLREWLPVVEAGLAGLTVGVIPPALDQVLIGTVDRSRNPDLKAVFLLGMNESIFPAAASAEGLLTEADRTRLEKDGVVLGPGIHQRLGREQYFGYIAVTRAAEQLVVTCSRRDARGRPLNPSPFFTRLQQLFPALPTGTFSSGQTAAAAEHPHELLPQLIRSRRCGTGRDIPESFDALTGFAPAFARADEVFRARDQVRLDPRLAEALYGRELRTSVTGLEEFAGCPFRFFARRGLRAEERQEFTVDAREHGSFQHEVLRAFHQRLRAEGRRWRDLTPDEARARVRSIGEELLPVFHQGLLDQSGTARLNARLLTEGLERMIAVLVGWMSQYEFDPAMVEVGFGLADRAEPDPRLQSGAPPAEHAADDGVAQGSLPSLPGSPAGPGSLPGWTLDLGEGHRLTLRGRIDRVDLCATGRPAERWSVVIDYKSSEHKLDVTRLRYGLDLQLLSYLNALAQVGSGRAEFDGGVLVPAGAFYVNLRGQVAAARARSEASVETALRRGRAYRHTGRFRLDVLDRFDNRRAEAGDQFSYRRKKDGGFVERSTEAVPPEEFRELLTQTEGFLRQHARAIFAGDARVAPYRHGQETACDLCPCLAICRFDPWVQGFRALAAPTATNSAGSTGDEPGDRRCE